MSPATHLQHKIPLHLASRGGMMCKWPTEQINVGVLPSEMKPGNRLPCGSCCKQRVSYSPPQDRSSTQLSQQQGGVGTKDNFLEDRTTKHQNRLHAKVLIGTRSVLNHAGQTFVRNDVNQVDSYLDREIRLDDCPVLFQPIWICGPVSRN